MKVNEREKKIIAVPIYRHSDIHIHTHTYI